MLLKNISEQIPTHAVIFDVSTDRGIRSGSQTITEIMYRLFLHSLGYARDLDLSELEITLETDDRLGAFVDKYTEIYGKQWDVEKGKVAFAMQQASRVMHELEPETYATVDSWRESVKDRADISPNLLAERCKALMQKRRPGRSLVFVIDEVGQFVARDVQKMLDLQAVVQSLGRVGRGKMWLIVTSQEKLNELVGGLDDTRVELARLMDRFPQPLQVHLEPSDISEVTSKRVLSKNADAQPVLRELFTSTVAGSPTTPAAPRRSRCRSSPPKRSSISTPSSRTRSISSSTSSLACGQRVEQPSTSVARTERSSSSPSSC